MDSHILSFELRALVKGINRYLGETMPESARIATGGNARIIMFLDRNRDKDIYQHTIEEKFCISRSTASRVLALMEKKGLIARVPVKHDARCKKIVLTGRADSIVNDLKADGTRMEAKLVDGFSERERSVLEDYVRRMRANIDRAQDEFRRQRDRMSPVEDAMKGLATATDGPAESGNVRTAPDGTGTGTKETKEESNE